MSHEERNSLLNEIEEIRTTIEKLQPEVHQQETMFGRGSVSSRAQLATLRKELARDMEQLHAS
jgi:predicted  nucleic acid-binding Zn-ribbon protein